MEVVGFLFYSPKEMKANGQMIESNRGEGKGRERRMSTRRMARTMRRRRIKRKNNNNKN